jgi:VanZ family protein
MNEEATSDGTMGEKAAGNESTTEESTDRHVNSLPIKSSFINSLLHYWLPPLLWMGLIFFLSAQSSLPHHPDILLDLILKKVAHVMEYGILAFLLWRALSRELDTLSWSALVIAFLVSVLYAASDEYHQTFVPGRNGTPVDVSIDAVGALIALLVVGSLRRKRRRE